MAWWKWLLFLQVCKTVFTTKKTSMTWKGKIRQNKISQGTGRGESNGRYKPGTVKSDIIYLFNLKFLHDAPHPQFYGWCFWGLEAWSNLAKVTKWQSQDLKPSVLVPSSFISLGPVCPRHSIFWPIILSDKRKGSFLSFVIKEILLRSHSWTQNLPKYYLS